MFTIIKYASVGSINTFVCVSIMWALSRLGIHYTLYTGIAYCCAFLTSFFLNLYFTFGAAGQLLKRFTLFTIINLSNLLQAEIIQIFFIEYLKTTHLLGILIGMCWYVLFGFFMNQRFVYPMAVDSPA